METLMLVVMVKWNKYLDLPVYALKLGSTEVLID